MSEAQQQAAYYAAQAAAAKAAAEQQAREQAATAPKPVIITPTAPVISASQDYIEQSRTTKYVPPPPPPVIVQPTATEIAVAQTTRAETIQNITETPPPPNVVWEYQVTPEAQRIMEVNSQSAPQPTYTVTTPEGSKTFNDYQAAETYAIESAPIIVKTIDDAGQEKIVTFKDPDSAQRYIERKQEDYVVAVAGSNYKAIPGPGASQGLINLAPYVKDLLAYGWTLDDEARKAKLEGKNALAGVLYSSGAALRFGTGLVLGPILLPETIYVAATDPKSIVDAMARDPLVTAANLALLGYGAYEGIKGWRANKLAEIPFEETQSWASETISGTPQRGAMLVEDPGSFINVFDDARSNRVWGSKLTDAQVLELMDPSTRFGQTPVETQPTNYSGPSTKLPMKFYPKDPLHPELGGRWEVLREGSWRKLDTLPADQLPAVEEMIKDYRLEESFITNGKKWPQAEMKLILDADGNPTSIDFGERYTNNVNSQAAMKEYQQIVRETNEAANRNVKTSYWDESGQPAPSGEGLITVMEEPKSEWVNLDVGESTYAKGGLPNPYFNQVSGGGWGSPTILLPGVSLVGPNALFYAALASVGQKPNISTNPVSPELYKTVPTVITNVNEKKLQPILNLIDTSVITKPRVDIIPIQLPTQIPVQTPMQNPVQEPMITPIQVPDITPIQDQPQIPEVPQITILEPPVTIIPGEPAPPKTPKPLLRKQGEKIKREYERRTHEFREGDYVVKLRYGRKTVVKRVDAKSFREALAKTITGHPSEVEVRRRG